MITTSYKSQLALLTARPARLLASLHLTPSTVTILGLFGTVASCAYYLLFNRNTFLFCALVLACGLCDALDGAVARLSGQTSRWGSYLDAMADRVSEAVIALTVAWVTGYWLLISVIIVNSFLISYAKARAAMEVAILNTEWPDVMERTERGLMFLAGLAASALWPRRWAGHDLFWWTLLVLAAATSVTVAQRMARARRFIKARGQSEGSDPFRCNERGLTP